MTSPDEPATAAVLPPNVTTGPGRAQVQKRTLTVVVISQVLGGAGLAAGVTVGALLAQQMLGSDSLAGVPTALFTLGSALAAYLIGRSTQHWGRRVGLAAGFTAGGVGAVGVVTAAVIGNITLLFAALFVYGAGTATNLQARYAGTDLARTAPTRYRDQHRPGLDHARRGRRTEPRRSPLAAGRSRSAYPPWPARSCWPRSPTWPPGSCCSYCCDPTRSCWPAVGSAELGPRRVDTTGAAVDQRRAPETTAPKPGVGAYVGATIMVLTQISMVAIMTMTPVHMRDHHHGLSEVGLVIGVHIAAMFLPSLITGILVDRVGRTPMAIAAGVTLLLAGVTGALAPGDSLIWLITALALLGLGWNFGLISGTALVVDATVPANRARTQGSIDVLVALAGAGGGALSGVVVSAAGYSTLALSGGVLALLLIPVLFWARR